MPFRLPADANLNSPQIKLLVDWNQGFQQLNADILAKYLHKDFRCLVYPGTVGEREQNKELWVQGLTLIFGFSNEIDTTVISIIEVPGIIVAHTINEVVSTLGLDAIHESLFIMHIVTDDDGSLKIRKLEEFRDSKVYSEYHQLLTAAIAANP